MDEQKKNGKSEFEKFMDKCATILGGLSFCFLAFVGVCTVATKLSEPAPKVEIPAETKPGNSIVENVKNVYGMAPGTASQVVYQYNSAAVMGRSDGPTMHEYQQAIQALALAGQLLGEDTAVTSSTETDEPEEESTEMSTSNSGYHISVGGDYDRGRKDQEEADIEKYCYEGRSIYDIEESVLDYYGITPAEAWHTIDEYNYDASHGGITWEEYQNAIQAAFATAGQFPE